MHERYAFGALVFLALLIADLRILVAWLVFGVAFTLNLLAAVPPAPWIGPLLPVQGALGIVGLSRDGRRRRSACCTRCCRRETAIRTGWWRRRREGPTAWTAALVVALAVGLPFLLWMGRGLTFFSDEWAFIESRSLGDPGTWLPPHNEHWSTLPILLYRGLVETIGLGSYVPYLMVVVALHGMLVTLVFAVVRRQSGPAVALGVAVLLLLFGSGFENLYWGFQTGFVGATAAGVAALLVVERDDSRRVVGDGGSPRRRAEATAGVALPFLVAIGVESAPRGRFGADARGLDRADFPLRRLVRWPLGASG